jgi:hypothetical protein
MQKILTGVSSLIVSIMSNIVNSRDSITRTDPYISKLVNDALPKGYQHVDADIQQDRGVQSIMTFLFKMVEEQPRKINYEPEFYVIQIPDLLKDETDTVKNICMFAHLRYFMVPSFRNEVDYLRDSSRQIKNIKGSFPSSEILDNCIRFYDEDIKTSAFSFEYFQ